ncbi:hypothetical protein B0J11DRAFT_157147 [Dendryphion nanum]|uniref:Uncharacterized protein n=1 Tax=Dendryphion nanum TaxID=256645 RepID=A0A9P9EEX4_9PLEO|nr:hypothetical protein B0J11DRAFT_157147 [Dendryphion nanum]
MLHVASLGSLLVQKVRGGRVWYGDSVSAWAKKTKQKIMLSISRSDAVEALLLLAVDAWWVVDLWRSACFTDYYAIRQYVRLQYTVCAQCTRLSSLLTTIAYTPLHSILPCPHFQSDPSLHRRISTSHHIPSTPPSHTKPFPGLDPQPQYPNPIPMSSPRTNPPWRQHLSPSHSTSDIVPSTRGRQRQESHHPTTVSRGTS